MNADFAILGCGWLGLPLARELVRNEFTVKGSTTSEAKLSTLKDDGVDAFLIKLLPDQVNGDITSLLNAQILIVNIPPGRRNPKAAEEYPKMMEVLLKHTLASPVQHILFISSTSVYGDAEGVVNESSRLTPNTSSGKALYESEKLFQTNFSSVTVLRLGGLVGANRNPGKFLAGRKQIPLGEAPVNLIHQLDIIRIIYRIIEGQHWHQVFNAVADFHPPKREYYTFAARALNLEPPEFIDGGSNSKTVNSSKISSILGYTLLYANPYSMLSKPIEV